MQDIEETKRAKEAGGNKNIEECYIKIPRSLVMSEQNKKLLSCWKMNRRKNKRCNKKAFFPK